MVLIAVSCLSMAVMARGARRQAGPATTAKVWRVPQKPAVTPKAAPVAPAKVMVMPPRTGNDRFLIEADGDIDPKMVMKADPEIDREMVFDPQAPTRPSLPVGPVTPFDNPGLPINQQPRQNKAR
jgi:hypothetical protein